MMPDKFIKHPAPSLLMVDDDEEDVYLTKRAFSRQSDNLIFNSVSDGPSLFSFLNREGEYSSVPDTHTPGIVLLDINMPVQNGFEVLEQLRHDPKHSHIPVVFLTTSSSDRDVRKAYQLGASSFICKSVNSAEMRSIAREILSYWFGFAKLPVVVP